MSHEVRIGILAVVTIALSLWGYKFIIGKNMLIKSNNFKVYYERVDGLQIGTQVRISGVRVGSVASVNLEPDQRVLVILDLERGIRIPRNTVATITSTGFMGGKSIELVYDQPCSVGDCAGSGDTLAGETKGMVSSMMGEENLEHYMQIIQEGLGNMIDTLNRKLLGEDSQSPIAESMRNLQGTLENLKSATFQIDRLMRNSSDDIDGAMSNLASITGTIASKNEQIAGLLSNAETVSQQLVAADLKKTIDEVNTAISDLKNTLQTADHSLAGVTSTVNKINQGEGTLGKLLNDDELYQNISALSQRADSLFSDLQERPYRYMPLKSRRQVKKFDRQDAQTEY